MKAKYWVLCLRPYHDVSWKQLCVMAQKLLRKVLSLSCPVIALANYLDVKQLHAIFHSLKYTGDGEFICTVVEKI